MTKTPGICTNTTDCAVARQARPILVPLADPFRCPSCGGPLTPPDPTLMRRSLGIPLVAGGAVILAVLFAAIWLSGPKPKPAPPVAPAAPPLPAVVVVTAVPTPAPPGLIGSSGPAGPTTGWVVKPSTPPETPAPGAPDATPAPPPPAAKPVEPPPPPPKPHAHRVVAGAGGPHAGGAAGHKDEVTVEMLPTDGTRPDYPDDYNDDSREGEVMATCLLHATGEVTACHIDNQVGGPAFGREVMNWLTRGSLRFPPRLKHGRPTSERFTWVVDFFP